MFSLRRFGDFATQKKPPSPRRPDATAAAVLEAHGHLHGRRQLPMHGALHGARADAAVTHHVFDVGPRGVDGGPPVDSVQLLKNYNNYRVYDYNNYGL